MNKSVLLLLFISLSTLTCGQCYSQRPALLPKPQHETYENQFLVLSRAGQPVPFAVKGFQPKSVVAVQQGIGILGKRLNHLGAKELAEDNQEHARILIEKIDQIDQRIVLVRPDASLSRPAREQAYLIDVNESDDGRAFVHLRASGDLGLFYGLITICQMIDHDDHKNIALLKGSIVDWPEVGVRIGKVSGTLNESASVKRFAGWLPFYKMNYCGIQFHGKDSAVHEHFDQVTSDVSGWARSNGIAGTIIYYCPFRGNAFDLSRQADRETYVSYLAGKMAEGAAGVEIDYNDWSAGAENYSDVINDVSRSLETRFPDAIIVYCPPLKGGHRYHGAATEELAKVLSEVPPSVMPVWTGFGMLPGKNKPLTQKQVEEWVAISGRKPLFWVNRVSPITQEYFRGKPIFARAIEPGQDDFVFQGELLPENLNQLFRGVHLNCGLGAGELPEQEFADRQRVCLATAAHYFWNPASWEARDSLRRAKRFVRIFRPIIESK